MRFLRKIQHYRLWMVALLVAVGFGCAGCSTMDADNTSARPWNSPDGWQNGNIPSNMMQPR